MQNSKFAQSDDLSTSMELINSYHARLTAADIRKLLPLPLVEYVTLAACRT